MHIMLLPHRKYVPLLVLAALMLAAYLTGTHEALSLETLQAHKDRLQEFAATSPFVAAAAFMAMYALCVALSLPVSTLLTLLGGFMFGNILGTALVVVAATFGATAFFLIARSSLGAALRDKAGTVYSRIEAGMRDNAASYLLFMRLVPLFPFWLVNIAAAVFNVPLRVFIVTTLLGIIPGSFVFVNLGRELGQIRSLDKILSGNLVMALVLLGLFALLPALYRCGQARKEKPVETGSLR